MKKILTLLAAIALTVACIRPMPLFAADEQTVKTNEKVSTDVAEINGKSYTSLSEAVQEVTDGQTIKILKDGDITGVKVAEGKNFIIDFNNKTVSIINPMVGSTGTETNGFQLLKNSNITLKNGTIKTTDSSNKILIQNYCNLTLENIVLDATQSSNTEYVLSNNYGNVQIKGNTSIIAYPDKVAFDVWYGMSQGYDDGISITFDNSFTGTISGNVEYGADKRAYEKYGNAWTEKAVINIRNGHFDIQFKDGNPNDLVAIKDANINIEGGQFSVDPTDYVMTGYKVYPVENTFKVAPAATAIALSDASLNLEVNSNKTLTAVVNPNETLDTVTWQSSDPTVATVENGVVTAVAPGTATITATAGSAKAECVVSVYKVEQPTPPAVDTEKPVEKPQAGLNDEKAPEILNETLNDIISKGENSPFTDKETAKKINSAISSGETITMAPTVEEINTGSTEATEDIKAIEKELKQITQENNSITEVAMYLDLSVLVKTSTTTLGNITVLPEPVTFTVVLPNDVAESAKDKDVYVLRIHEGKVDKIKASLVDHVITFETDRFSTYAVVFEEKTVTPTPEVKTHQVIFVDMNGAVLKVETVKDGEKATAPTVPTIEGYTFTKWDTDFSKVTGDLVVTAVYEKLPVEETVKPADKEENKTGETENPSTGDRTNASLYSAFGLLGLVSAALIVVEKKRRSLSR